MRTKWPFHKENLPRFRLQTEIVEVLTAALISPKLTGDKPLLSTRIKEVVKKWRERCSVPQFSPHKRKHQRYERNVLTYYYYYYIIQSSISLYE